MKHPSFDPNCGICKLGAGEQEVFGGVIFEDDHWLVRHQPPPIAVPGWVTIQAQRHTPSIARFDDAEAASFGPVMRRVQGALQEVTGAVKIYTVAMGESFPHFHAHIVPRHETMPNKARGYAVFGLQSVAQKGELQVDPAEVERIIRDLRAALR